MRALVVGADGFAGRWLVRHLHASGDEVTGLVGPRYRRPLEGAARVARVDVREYEPLAAAIAASRPEALYFLAAVSQAGGRERIADAARIGLVGAIHALTACAELGDPVRFLHVSSSHVYGEGGDGPLTEDSPVRPTSVYGAAKAASERALLTLGPAAGVEVVVARAFNHIGPGQQVGFVVPSLARQVIDIERGAQEPIIRAGNVDVRRDFTDVRDVVRAYRLAAVDGTDGEVYNIASGRAVSVREVLDALLRLRSVHADVERDPDLSRAGEPMSALVGDPGKLTALTGWRPEIPIEQSLADVIDSLSRAEPR